MSDPEIHPEQHEKPLFLYHASPNRQIERFEPRAERVRRPDEGPRVFATPEIASATKFMMDSDDSWVSLGQTNGVEFAVYGDRDKFLQLDQGGAVYVLPSESFAVDQPDEHPDEWTSPKPVMPIEKIEYDSALEAMLSNGVQVFFVDQATLEKVRAAAGTEEIVEVLNNLESENKRLGRNVKIIPVVENGDE